MLSYNISHLVEVKLSYFHESLSHAFNVTIDTKTNTSIVLLVERGIWGLVFLVMLLSFPLCFFLQPLNLFELGAVVCQARFGTKLCMICKKILAHKIQILLFVFDAVR